MPPAIDLTGKHFGKLIAIRPTEKRQFGKVVWLLQCTCPDQKYIEVNTSDLKSGKVQSCGCIRNKNLKGYQFGRLTILEFGGYKRRGNRNCRTWKAKCVCGTIVNNVFESDLLGGGTKSCGCLSKELTSKRRKINMIGKRFGKLIVVAEAPRTKGGRINWHCDCDCGGKATVTGEHLRDKKTGTKSCGCLRIPAVRKSRCMPPGDAARNQLYSSYKKVAKERGLAFELTKEEFINLIAQDCFYCNSPPFAEVKRPNFLNGVLKYNGVDRVDNTKGYIKGNVVTACKFCNFAKRTLSVIDFFIWLNCIVKNFDSLEEKMIEKGFLHS